MNLSRRKIRDSLQTLWRRRQTLIRATNRPQRLLMGTVYDVLRRCGNPSCHCAQKPAHRQTLLIYIQQGKRICRFIRKEDRDWVRKAWHRYRQFKARLRELRAINQQEMRLLEGQMREYRIYYE